MDLPNQKVSTPEGQSRPGVEQMSDLLRQFEINQLHRQFIDRLVILAIASLGLITALAWDETLREIFRRVFGGEESLSNKLLYTAIITLIAITVSILLSKFSTKSKKKK